MSSTAPRADTISSVSPSAAVAVVRIVWLIVSPVTSAAPTIVVKERAPKRRTPSRTPSNLLAAETPDRRLASPSEAVRKAEQDYLNAIAILSKDVSERRSSLNPEMLSRVDDTLKSIDRTIVGTREAVKNNPNDPVAAQYPG